MCGGGAANPPFCDVLFPTIDPDKALDGGWRGGAFLDESGASSDRSLFFPVEGWFPSKDGTPPHTHTHTQKAA